MGILWSKFLNFWMKIEAQLVSWTVRIRVRDECREPLRLSWANQVKGEGTADYVELLIIHTEEDIGASYFRCPDECVDRGDAVLELDSSQCRELNWRTTRRVDAV